MPDNAKPSKRARIGILISGRGSNMVALVDAVDDGRIPYAEIAVVISDQPEARGLVKARDRGIETVVIERSGRRREEHDREIVTALQNRRVDLVCLAGYMRVLSGEFLTAFPRRILNIHPSLLPSFPGLEAQKQALVHGAKVSGCTVHFVDQTLDGGPIIAQRVVPVLDDDTVDSLSARILVEEHQLYPEAVAMVLSNNLQE
ncbi:MAG TPA: phosphoribosylglycinamide formyltransferase [Pyrinomonadaceae bacterium]|nr:phosphoribosylglycinamide formyltransferase [Pyrinomonadaceae bacterium]